MSKREFSAMGASRYGSHMVTVSDLATAQPSEVGVFFTAHIAVVEGSVRAAGARSDVAEDCAAEGFRRLYESYIRGSGTLENPHVPARALWCRIARNTFVDQYRKGRREWVLDIWPMDAAFPDMDTVVQYHLCEGKLVGDDALLASFHAGGYLLREISGVIGKSIAQTGKDISRVLRRLADCMEAA